MPKPQEYNSSAANPRRHDDSPHAREAAGMAETGQPEGSPWPAASPPTVSGLYIYTQQSNTQSSRRADPFGAVFREELRLDVDGRYPQMVVSGTIQGSLRERVHWIASVRSGGQDHYTGEIWYQDGATAGFPYHRIDLRVQRSAYPDQRSVTVTFSASGNGASRTRTYAYASPHFRSAEFEYDAATGETPVTSVQTHAHPNHPSTLPSETLSIAEVYQRAGFDTERSGDASVVPLSLAGADARWSDAEMHDAMQQYWSLFASRPQWAMWTFFASLHERGPALGGVMFDDIGPNHRQGTAVFQDAFVSDAPSGDPNPEAWVRRMRFWTAVHEMGHAFNLAHSWQKALGAPWRPLQNVPEARSFMNYPFRVRGGAQAFFSNFAYRFDDDELLFLRHAPERFVQQGNADWFDNHGFSQARVRPAPIFRLEVRVNRPQPTFEFMEPVVLEFKLTNTSGRPQVIDAYALADRDAQTIVLKKDGKPARQFAPYAHYLRDEQARVLQPNASMYESVFLGAGANGWDLAEPGLYTVQVALHLEAEDVVSLPFRLRIAPPKSWEEERLAQDFFSEDVGRLLTFGGSRLLEHGNDALRAVTDRMDGSAASVHARLVLGRPLARSYKMLSVDDGGPLAAGSVQKAGGAVEVHPAREDEAHEQLRKALLERPDAAARTLGHVSYKRRADALSAWLAERNASEEAAVVQGTLYDTLQARDVLERVLEAVMQARERYEKEEGA